MDSKTRIENIKNDIKIEKRKGSPKRNKLIFFDDIPDVLDAYNISLSNLIYNQHNGRIMSSVKSDIASDVDKSKLDPETPEGKTRIEKYLLDSNAERNRKTEIDILKSGQKEIGIITRDGIIIDGNRRAMLLNKNNIPTFLCVVLAVDYDDKPELIQKLEAQYQMGEDEKLTYNANEKYFKAEELKKLGVSIKDIADAMNEETRTINTYLRVKTIMDKYLMAFDYDGILVRLKDREEAFLNIDNWSRKYKKTGDEWDYDEDDVSDLTTVAFDYIRAIYQSNPYDMNWQEIRKYLAGGRDKDSHIFGSEKIWKTFRDKHFEGIQKIKDQEIPAKEMLNSINYAKSLESRDTEFAKNALPFMIENFRDAVRSINRQQHINKPSKLISNAVEDVKSALEHGNLTDQDYTELNDLIGNISINIRSLLEQLKQIHKLSDEIKLEEIENTQENKEELFVEADAIQKRIFDIRKVI